MSELQIKNNGVIITLKNPDSDGYFRFKSIKIEKSGNIFYEDNSIIQRHILEQIKSLATSELTEYIERNKNSYNFYNDTNSYGFLYFWDNVFNMKLKNECYKLTVNDVKLNYHQISDGIVECEINRHLCTYSLKEDKFIKTNVKPLNIFFKEHELNLIVALEQYKINKAHKTFKEMVELNQFLDGKKSITMHLKNGLDLLLKNDWMSASTILNSENNKFYVRCDCYDIKKNRQKDSLPIEELDYLKHGKNVYKINPDNFNLGVFKERIER